MMGILRISACLCLFLFLVQCNKDAKIEPIVRLLPNGDCGISLNTGPRSTSVHRFYLKDNFIYPVLYDPLTYKITSICFSRIAGYLYLDKYDSVRITPIKMKLNNGDPCSFLSDIHGEDKYELHFSNISSGISYVGSRKYFSGNFYYNVQSGLPFNKINGTFTLSVK
jgi:hypothetical protein